MANEMVVAVASEGLDGLAARVAGHFGRCNAYTFVTLTDGEVTATRAVQNPFASGHGPGDVPRWIHEEGADVILSGGMGGKAVEFFNTFGVTVGTGAKGLVGSAVRKFLAGQITSTEPCDHSQDEDPSHHHHH